jgi:benzoyl-CoA reductase/2-hydroxyglutaryl-CoA dehydratase subunit BcrC/BadD/HgdB
MMTEEKHKLLKTISEGMESSAAFLAEMAPSESDDQWAVGTITGLLADYWKKGYAAYQNGDPVAFTNFGIPTELFYAMDIVPVVADVLSANATTFGFAHQYNDLAAEQVPEYLCSNNTILLGSLLSGDMEPPSIMVHPANPCDSNMGTYPVFSEYFEFPYFMIDMPYITTEKSIPYVTNEYKKLVTVLEEITGRKLDYDRLRQTMEYSNIVHDHILKLGILREAVPSPYSSMEVMSEIGLVMCLAGTKGAAEYILKRYEYIKAKVERKEGYFTKEEEKLRIVWIYGAPVFDFDIYEWSEREHGAVLVSQMNNNYVMEPVKDISDTDHILAGLANKLILMPMTRECGGPWENYLQNSIDLLKRYKADVGIFGGNVGCKSNWAVAKLVKDRIQEELGIPICNVELDLFDDRITSSDAVKAQLGEYFTMIKEKKQKG